MAKKINIVVAEQPYGPGRETLATQLLAIKEEKADIEQREKEVTDALLSLLQAQGVGFVRLDNGTSFTRFHRETLEIVDEVKAHIWAEKNNCYKIDTTKAWKIMRREMKLPKFFKRKVGADYLTVKRAGEKDDE